MLLERNIAETAMRYLAKASRSSLTLSATLRPAGIDYDVFAIPGLAAKVHSNLMCRLSIVFSVALLLCGGNFARGQEKPTPSQDSQPVLKRCSDKNPPPCADKPPVVTYQPDPECSREAEKAKIEGTVVLHIVVGTDGLVHDTSVVRSLGYGLDEEAIKALKKWKFKPATEKGSGKPAPVKINVEVTFRRCPA